MLLNNIDKLIQESLTIAASGLGQGLLRLGSVAGSHIINSGIKSVKDHSIEPIKELPRNLINSTTNVRSDILTHAKTISEDPSVRHSALGVGLLGLGALALPYVKAGTVVKKTVDYSTEIR
jgi:hypothetical protein